MSATIEQEQEQTPQQQNGENDAQSQDAATQQAPPNPAKKRRTLIIASMVLLLVIAGAVAFYLHSLTYESTDDAQIDGHLNPIASRVAGTVRSVYVENNQRVEAGKLLVELDPSDLEVTLAQSEAEYSSAIAQLRGEQPNLPITVTSNQTDAASAREEVANAEAALAGAEHEHKVSLAKLQQAEADNGKAQLDIARYKQLLDKHEVAQSEFDQYDATAKAQAAAVDAQRASVNSASKTIDQRHAQLRQQQAKLQQTLQNAPRQILIRNATVLQRKASMESSAAQVRQDKLNLSYTRIVAPVAGIVTQRNAEVGARISVGQQLMMIVQTTNLWVTANFKETQFKKMKTGQRVTVKVDALERDVNAYIEDMPASTGDRTSALPPENATGNYVKIVQRMPVRIRFRDGQDGLNALRPGMSVVPTVHFE